MKEGRDQTKVLQERISVQPTGIGVPEKDKLVRQKCAAVQSGHTHRDNKEPVVRWRGVTIRK